MEDIHANIILFMHDRTTSARVCKRWKKLCDDAVRHPLIAAKYGDMYSIHFIWKNAIKIPRSDAIASILIDNGHEKVAKRYFNVFNDNVLMRSKDEMTVKRLIMNTDSPHYCHAAVLGPSFVAYHVARKLNIPQHVILRGLCRGGHLDEVKRLEHLISEHYTLSMIMEAINSRNVELVEFLLDRTKDGAVLEFAYELVDHSMGSTMAISKLIAKKLNLGEVRFGLLDVDCTTDIETFRYLLSLGVKPNKSSVIEAILSFNKVPNNEDATLELCDMYPEFLIQYMLEAFCFRGNMRLAKKIADKFRNKCEYCHGKFH